MSNYLGKLILPCSDLLKLRERGSKDPLCSVVVVPAFLNEEKLAWSYGVHIVIGRTSMCIKENPLNSSHPE